MIILHTMRGALGGFSPLQLTPALWFDSSDPATRYDATTGGSLVTTNGAAVARLEDKSGNGRHATQATALSRPILATATRNGRDGLTFDGSNDWLATPAFTATQAFTRVLVFASLANQYKVLAAHGSAFATPNPGADYLATNALRLEGSQNGTGQTVKTASANNTPTGTWVLATQICDGTNAGHTLRLNRATFALNNLITGNPGTFTKAATAYGLGAYNAGGSPAHCHIGEMILVPGLLTATRLDQLEAWLATKWAI